jgi:hypothetical protein
MGEGGKLQKCLDGLLERSVPEEGIVLVVSNHVGVLVEIRTA